MKKVYRFLTLVAMFAATTMFSSCFWFDDLPTNGIKEIHVGGVTINGAGIDIDGVAVVQIGTTIQLLVIVTPDNVDAPNISFVSSDENVATVTPQGLITALAEGEVTITVVSNDDPNVSTPIVVRVVNSILTVVDDPSKAASQADAEARQR